MDGESDKLQIINDFLIKHNDLFKSINETKLKLHNNE